MSELNASDYDIQPLNFISENEFFEAAKGMTIQEISFLEGFLLKKEE